MTGDRAKPLPGSASGSGRNLASWEGSVCGDLAACGHCWDPIIPLERGEGNFSQTPWLLRKRV